MQFAAVNLREWLSDAGIIATFIELENPWENGYIESFSGKMCDELLNGEIYDSIFEARILIE